jgi:NADP-dependent 3-hydroxy acid dehydrogenase YdfG
MSLPTDARVLVTGAASGLGLALVRRLVDRGSHVLATDVAESLPDTLAGLDRVTYRRLDVTSDVDWASARDHVVETWGRLDVLFNNAGVAAGGRIELTELDQWQWIVDVNLLGVVRGCRTFAPLMVEQGSGHLVNTASAAGLVHMPTMSEYNAVKAGVVALSETLFFELHDPGVRVSTVCPTFFRTNLAASLRGKDEQAQQTAERLIAKAKVGADEVAERVLAGVDRDQRVIVPNADGRALWALKRHARPVYDRLVLRTLRGRSR